MFHGFQGFNGNKWPKRIPAEPPHIGPPRRGVIYNFLGNLCFELAGGGNLYETAPVALNLGTIIQCRGITD